MHILSPKCIHYPQNAYIELSFARIIPKMHILHCLLPELSPKCIHYPQNAYIIPKMHILSLKCIYYPQNAYIIPKMHILSPKCIHYP